MNPLKQPYEYGHGYIILNVPQFRGLPQQIDVEGVKLLLKSEFHISLICTKRIAELINPSQKAQIEDEIIEEFEAFTRNNDLTVFKPTKNFRLVERGERKTIVMMVELPGLEQFFSLLSERYSKSLPPQPTHITMYTQQPNAGIGILSHAELEDDSKVVEVTELANQQFEVEPIS